MDNQEIFAVFRRQKCEFELTFGGRARSCFTPELIPRFKQSSSCSGHSSEAEILLEMGPVLPALLRSSRMGMANRASQAMCIVFHP